MEFNRVQIVYGNIRGNDLKEWDALSSKNICTVYVQIFAYFVPENSAKIRTWQKFGRARSPEYGKNKEFC